MKLLALLMHLYAAMTGLYFGDVTSLLPVLIILYPPTLLVLYILADVHIERGLVKGTEAKPVLKVPMRDPKDLAGRVHRKNHKEGEKK